MASQAGDHDSSLTHCSIPRLQEFLNVPYGTYTLLFVFFVFNIIIDRAGKPKADNYL